MPNLSPKIVKLLRQTQRFIMREPRRYDMHQGITESNCAPVLEQPPCGTACCIAGSMYAISKKITLDHTRVGWMSIITHITGSINEGGLGMSNEVAKKLFYVPGLHAYTRAGVDGWPENWAKLYREATTPRERACVGVAYIEHFIATDGKE